MSDVLDVFRLIKTAKAAAAAHPRNLTLAQDDDPKERMANAYINYTKTTNMVDQFDLLRILKKSLGEEDSADLKTYLDDQLDGHVLVNLSYYCDQKSVEKELFQTLFRGQDVSRITLETSLDSSLVQESSSSSPEVTVGVQDLCLDDFYLESGHREEDSSKTELYVQQWTEGYLRLLINSRDELSLGRILCGPCGIMDPKAFHIIKQESAKTRMPIFQTIVSYVQRSKLTGNRDAPTSEHPFHPYQKEILDFNEFMDKLQDRVEDERDPESMCKKILHSLKCLAFKLSSSGLHVAKVESRFASLAQLATDLTEGRNRGLAAYGAATPQRNVGAGGSMAGRINVKVKKYVDLNFLFV